jgi:hypothetical protein
VISLFLLSAVAVEIKECRIFLLLFDDIQEAIERLSKNFKLQ